MAWLGKAALKVLGKLRFTRPTTLQQTRAINCAGDTSELTGLVLGVNNVPNEPNIRAFTETTNRFDELVQGRLTDAMRVAGPTPLKNEFRVFYGLHPAWAAVAVVGLGPECLGYDELEELDELKEAIRNATGLAGRNLQDLHMRSLYFDTMGHPESAAEGAAMGVWLYQEMRSVNQQKLVPKIEPYDTCDYTGWQIGLQKAAAQNLARQLCESPANILTPIGFAQTAVQILTSNAVSVEVKVREWSQIMGLNGYLASAKGSCEAPVFVELHYYGCDPDVAPVVLVGKGVTFDSGGLCLKPCKQQKYMRGDMAGAASVVATARAVSALRLPINLRGIIPLYENLPGSCAMKPGDIIQSRSGKTVMMNNTDYDGRLAMADALSYSSTYNPRFIASIGTFSSELHETYGEGPSTVYSNNESLFEMMRVAAMHTGDRIWRLPLWKHFTDKIQKTKMADAQDRIENYPQFDRFTGVPPQLASFLYEFVPAGTDWIHVDMFNAMVTDGKEYLYLRPGMSGRPTRTLIEFLAQIACQDNTASEDSAEVKPFCQLTQNQAT